METAETTTEGEPVTLLAFVDVESTGLDPRRHEVWEVGIIEAEHRPGRLVLLEEWCAQVQVEHLENADPFALRVGGFYDRRSVSPSARGWVASQVERRTRGRMMVGAVPSFDAGFLTPLLHEHGYPVGWHYQLVDIETLAAGWLMGRGGARTAASDDLAQPPWSSDDLTGALGVSVEPHDRHTALGDARWALETYAAVYGLTIDREERPTVPVIDIEALRSSGG